MAPPFSPLGLANPAAQAYAADCARRRARTPPIIGGAAMKRKR